MEKSTSKPGYLPGGLPFEYQKALVEQMATIVSPSGALVIGDIFVPQDKEEFTILSKMQMRRIRQVGHMEGMEDIAKKWCYHCSFEHGNLQSISSIARIVADILPNISLEFSWGLESVVVFR